MNELGSTHYVIVGNGVAGMNAAGAIRRRNERAKISIISAESEHFFARTALMYVQCGQMSEEDIRPFGSQHYEQMQFNRVSGRVVSLNANAGRLTLDDGREIGYDRLLIAAGSVPRMLDWPGRDLDGVGNFVTWPDLEWMRGKAATSRRAVIVGGGLIGVEVAEVLLKAGIDVTMVIREKWYWPVALDRREGEMIQEHMERHGCKLLLQTECKEIVGREGKVVGLKTSQGDVIDCDMVVFTIGVTPQTEWLIDSGVVLDDFGGVVVGDRVDYASLKQGRAPLDGLVDTIGKADLDSATTQQKLSFFINAYNILTLRSIIDAYPVKSIKDIDGVWDNTRWIVAGDRLTLNEIEHEILRKKFDEPRIHVAVNCASIGCPPLLAVPYYPDSLDAQLELSSRRFALSTLHNAIDPQNGVAKLSAIFDWFGEDFVKRYHKASSFPGASEKENAALNFVSQYLDSTLANEAKNTTYDIEYIDYDWSLNDVE